MTWDAVIFDFEDTLVDLSRGRPTTGAPMYYAGAKGVPPTRDPNGRAFVDVLGRLVEAGTPVAIVTNSPEAAMGRWFAEQHFAYPVVVVGFHDTVLHRPSPHPLLEALARLGVAPSSRVLAVGDSTDDLEAARRAGLTTASIRPQVPLCHAPDLLLPYVESFFDDEQVFTLAGDYETDLPGVSLEAELDGHVCRVGGRVRQNPRNRLAQWIEQGRAGQWHTAVVELGVTLVAHSLGADRQGAVLTWIPPHTGREDSMQAYMARLKASTSLTTTRLLDWAADPGEQRRRGRERREKAMDGALRLRGKVDLAGRTVVVVDDVRHTGATLAEAARALREGGAARVVGVALAQEEFRAPGPRAAYGPLGTGRADPQFLDDAEAEALGAAAPARPAPEQGELFVPREVTPEPAPPAAEPAAPAAAEASAARPAPASAPTPAPAPAAPPASAAPRAAKPAPPPPPPPPAAPRETDAVASPTPQARATPPRQRPVARPLSGARPVSGPGAARARGPVSAAPPRAPASPAAPSGPMVARPNAEPREHRVESVPTRTDPLVVARGKRKMPPPRTPEEVKARYPRAYQRWTPEEDEHLARVFAEGLSLDAMADALGRQPKAVETRIRKLDIDIRPEDLPEEPAGEPSGSSDDGAPPAADDGSASDAAASAASDAAPASLADVPLDELPPGALAAEMKRRYPRAYQPWTAEEDATLRRLHRAGASKRELVAALKRQPKAVESRIRKLGIDTEDGDDGDDREGAEAQAAAG